MKTEEFLTNIYHLIEFKKSTGSICFVLKEEGEYKSVHVTNISIDGNLIDSAIVVELEK